MPQDASSTTVKGIGIFVETGWARKFLAVLAIAAAITFSCLKFVLGTRYQLTLSGERAQLVDRWTGVFYRPDIENGLWRQDSQ